MKRRGEHSVEDEANENRVRLLGSFIDETTRKYSHNSIV